MRHASIAGITGITLLSFVVLYNASMGCGGGTGGGINGIACPGPENGEGGSIGTAPTAGTQPAAGPDAGGVANSPTSTDEVEVSSAIMPAGINTTWCRDGRAFLSYGASFGVTRSATSASAGLSFING